MSAGRICRYLGPYEVLRRCMGLFAAILSYAQLFGANSELFGAMHSYSELCGTVRIHFDLRENDLKNLKLCEIRVYFALIKKLGNFV